LFDLAIIKASNGKKNLDDLMNYLYKVYYKEKKRGFTDDEFKETVKQVAGQSFDDLFESIYTTRTPDYQKYLEGVGVSLVILYPDTNKPLLGATFQEINGKLIIKGVQRNTAAYNDGLNVEDEIIAVDGYRVNQDKLNKYIQNLLPGTKVKFLISRDDLLKEITVELKPNYSPKYYLVNNQQKTPEQQKYFNCWMRETNK
jgi:predicted metalloprotease with PDZ domain